MQKPLMLDAGFIAMLSVWQTPNSAASRRGVVALEGLLSVDASRVRSWPGLAKAAVKLAAANQSSKAGQQGKF